MSNAEEKKKLLVGYIAGVKHAYREYVEAEARVRVVKEREYTAAFEGMMRWLKQPGNEVELEAYRGWAQTWREWKP